MVADNPSHTAVISRHVVLSRRAPTAADLWQLQQAGIRTVLDLRLAWESDSGLAPEQEADAVHAHGMQYRAWPVAPDISGRDVLDRFREIIAHAAKPVLVHDTDGRRAGLLSVVHTASETGVPGKEMLRMARSLDVLYGTRGQKQRLAAYVDLHEVQTDPLERRKQVLHGQAVTIPLLPEGYQLMAEEFKEDHARRIAEDRDIVRADLTQHPPMNPAMAAPLPPTSGAGETPVSVYHPTRWAVTKAAVRRNKSYPAPAPNVAGMLFSRRTRPSTGRPRLAMAALAVSAASAAVWLLRRHPVAVLFVLGFVAQRGLGAASSQLRRRGHLPPGRAGQQEEEEVSRLERDLDRLAAA